MIIFSLQTLGISPYANILTIQVKIGKIVKIWKIWDYADEKSMIRDFMEYFLSLRDKIIIGYNLLKFDLPLLLLKARELPKFEEFFKKINRSNVVDLFTILTFLNKGRIKSLDYHCKAYNITGRNVPLNEMISLYENKKYEEFERNALANLNNLSDLFSKVWSEIIGKK
jgi:DNA polymerase elongation subunit (family B)